jgi:predicted nucleic acid-binding Zn ribbon protein
VPWSPLPDAAGDEPAPVGSALDRVVTHLGGPSSSALTDLFDRWDELAGPALAGHTRPVALRDGVLVVGVEDPAWASPVRFGAPGLLARVRDGLPGVRVVAVEVRVRSGGAG